MKGGDDAVVAFETWLETGDESLLRDVERYNEEDCRSTYELHEWLLSIRPADRPWRLPPDERPPSEEAIVRDAERAALRDRLLAGTEEGDPRRLLGTSWSTTSARRDPSGGRGSAGRSSTRTSSSRTAPHSVGCGGTGSRRRSRARATRTA